jgi:Transglutaminase-like superfamily
MNSLRKARRLSPGEQRLLAQAMVLLPLARGAVCLLGIKHSQRLLSRLAITSNQGLPNPEQRAHVIARMVKIAAERRIINANCLQQTLVLWFLLRHHGIDGEICFGARKQEGEVQAHAWVEYFGQALNEDQEVCRHFSPFAGVEVALRPQTNE